MRIAGRPEKVQTGHAMVGNKHEQRHRIVQKTVDVIARDGVEAATVRRIAAELGYSTTIVTYYFADKKELLRSAYTLLDDEVVSSYDAVLEANPTDLIGFLLCMTPADAAGVRRWKTYLSLWNVAARDPGWASVERNDVELAIARTAAVLQAKDPHLDRARATEAGRTVNLLIQGLSIQTLMDPLRWSRSAIEAEIVKIANIALGREAALQS